MASKLDLSKELKECYKAKKKPDTVYVPEGRFLSILGQGDPNGEEYQHAIQALYAWAYTLKFHYKAQDLDFKVMPLEGLWWVTDGIFDINNPSPRENWRWRSMIRVPDFVEDQAMNELLPGLVEKKGGVVDKVTLFTYHEGISAQVMHLGPYSEEASTINMLHEWVEKQGYRLRGDHHEIYLSDPRRAAPEKMKTIIRHPLDELGLG
jgi:hypothetical protein